MQTPVYILILFGMVVPAVAQPSTDVWVVSLAPAWATVDAGAAVNVTDRSGYDNQPAFTADGAAVLYTSMRGEQTDIYRYDLATGEATQVTRTAESEYSPTPMPASTAFSVIQVEADGTQRLWSFDAEGTAPKVVLEAIKPVGYHAWGDARTLGLFVLGAPPTLQRADTRTGQADTLAWGIGRSLHRIPGEAAISFVHKRSDDDWMISRLDLATNAITPLMPTLPGREDYAWHPDGRLLMADGAVLYHTRPGAEGWTPVADFSGRGINQITRLAVSPQGDRLALVAQRAEE